MKKNSKSSLKKKGSLDISLQYKNEASYEFSKKNFSTRPKKGLELRGLMVVFIFVYAYPINRAFSIDNSISKGGHSF